MDGLSAVASILALIEASVAVARGIENLKALKQLPKDFASLLEEVRDLQHQLGECKHAVDDGSKSPKTAVHGGKFEELARAGTCKLERLAKELPASSCQDGLAPMRKLHVYWTGMVDGKSRLRRCRDEVRDIRLGIVQAIGTLTAPVVVGLDAKVDEIVGAQREFRAAQQEILQTVLAIGQHAREAGLQRPPSYESSVSQTTTTVSINWNSPSPNMTRRKPTRAIQAPGSTTTAISDVRIPQDKFARFCLPWCSCQCHMPTYMNSYDALKDIFGCLRISHSGVPGLTKKCNETRCRRRMSPKVTMRYRLPRAIASFQYLTCSFSTFAGPELRVKLPRVVDWSSPVWQYVTTGNNQALTNLFRNGLASPWDVSPLGGNLLHYATDHWNAELCKLLLDADLDCEAEDDFKGTAVCIAWERVLSGQMSADDACTVASLFEDVDYLSSRSFSVIHKIVLGLVSKDLDYELHCSTASINTPDSRGRTPLSWASLRGDEYALRTLLKHGADPSIPDVQGQQPLHLVRNTSCAELLLEHGADVHARNDEGRTPLYTACRNVQSASLIRFLVDSGADVNAPDNGRERPLHNIHTVSGTLLPFVSVLLEHGADVNLGNGGGDTPLLYSVIFNRHAILRRMLRECKDADLGVVNSHGQSFAHAIARSADAETVRILIEARPGTLRPELSLRDRHGKTAQEYFDERVEFMEEDEEGVLRGAFADLVAILKGSAKEDMVEGVKAGDKLDVTVRVEEVGVEEEEEMEFHDAVEVF